MLSKPLYLSLVKKTKFGKSLPDSVYLHKDYLDELPSELKRFLLGLADTLKLQDSQWDVVKLFKSHFKISFLSYPSFYLDPYPELKHSTTVDLESLKTKEITYNNSQNPPILHRKELFIPPSNSYFKEFSEITLEGEKIGLYKNTSKIGFKQGWLKTIKENGYSLENGELIPLSPEEFEQSTDPNSKIDRHKTALTRYEFSLPLKKLLEHGQLSEETTVFDYGCGKGSDLYLLKQMNIDAEGWDPTFRPDTLKKPAEIVNLGFVLNVIENYQERVEALINAWELTQKLLCVSVMITSDKYISQFEPYKDGVITSRNTFQKYYSQKEVRAFLEEHLMTDAYSVAPGVFFIFKTHEDAIEFEQASIKRKHAWQQLKIPRLTKQDQYIKLISENQTLFDALWQRCLELGRPPRLSEFTQEQAIIDLVGSLKKALDLLFQLSDIKDFEDSTIMRREDLLFFFAMSLFQKRQNRKITNPELLNDVKHFFTNKTQAEQEARELLQNLADTKNIVDTSKTLLQSKTPYFYNQDHSIILHKDFIPEIPLLLRLYIGCATMLYGGLDEIDLVKIHLHSGKVSFMGYDDFDNSMLPTLRERIKVNLWSQNVDYFDYLQPEKRPLLLNSSVFISTSHPYYKMKKSFEKRLENIIPNINQLVRLNKSTLSDVLNDSGYTLKGTKFFKIKQPN